jgi:hypothetical protein
VPPLEIVHEGEGGLAYREARRCGTRQRLDIIDLEPQHHQTRPTPELLTQRSEHPCHHRPAVDLLVDEHGDDLVDGMVEDLGEVREWTPDEASDDVGTLTDQQWGRGAPEHLANLF